MADILPYLGVRQSFGEEDRKGQLFVLEDYTGLTADQAEKRLKQSYLSCRKVGDGDLVTGQIPAAGQSVPGESEILLYFGETPDQTMVTMPDFRGLTPDQAESLAGSFGLYILAAGNPSQTAVAAEQSVAPGQTVPTGSTVTLIFADMHAAD